MQRMTRNHDGVTVKRKTIGHTARTGHEYIALQVHAWGTIMGSATMRKRGDVWQVLCQNEIIETPCARIAYRAASTLARERAMVNIRNLG